MMSRMLLISSHRSSGSIVTSLEVVGRAYNITDGTSIIKEKKPDLVFLDVEMPNGTGFDLLAQFPG